MKILGHSEVPANQLSQLTYMVRSEGWPVFVEWCKGYGIEVSLGAIRNKDDDDATGKVFVLDEIADFRQAVEDKFAELESELSE